MHLPDTVGVFAAAAFLLTPAFAAEPEALRLPAFSATEAMDASGGYFATSRIYHAESKFRVEPGPGFVTIYLPALDRVYTVLGTDPLKTACIFESMDKASMMHGPIQELSGAMVKRSDAGTEVVDGHPCKVTTMTVIAAEGEVGHARVCEAQDLDGFPVKVEWRTGRKLTAVYRDVVLAAPDPALFEPPANCIPIEQAGEVAEEVRPPEPRNP